MNRFKNHKHIASWLTVAGLVLTTVFSVSCLRSEEAYDVKESVGRRMALSVVVDDLDEIVQTKSILTDPNIETKVTSVTLAIYDSNNVLFDARDYTSGFDAMSYSFQPNETYRIFAVANMGPMASSFPSTYSDAGIQGITYTIPGYTTANTGVNTRGIPMAGTLTFVCGESDVTAIPLTRLLAKLNVHLECNWPGNIVSVKVKNLNAKLKPFGSSVASSSGDVLSEEEVEIPSTDISMGDFVFYVPENLQGTVAGITNPADKQGDDTDVSNPVNAKAAGASYIETVITGESAYSNNGTITFRSYLGDNATTDFNIIRNNRYAWSISYYPTGMANDDWKHDNEMSWKRYSFSRSWPSVVYWNTSGDLRTRVYADVYTNGVLINSSVSQSYSQLPSGLTYQWTITPGNNYILSPWYRYKYPALRLFLLLYPKPLKRPH